MNTYTYEGPVYSFGNLIAPYWFAETKAVSKDKARSNFKYQFKKQHSRAVTSKIDLPGDIIEIL